MTSPLVSGLFDATAKSCDDLRREISNVKRAGFIPDFSAEQISFDFRGEPYLGKLTGRNRNLCLGFGEENDRAIALRVLIDGEAQKII